MKVFIATLVILIIAFASIKMIQQSSQNPQVESNSTVQIKHAPKQTSESENMTQFSNDFAKFMKDDLVKDGMPSDGVTISAKCKSNQGAYNTRCWLVFTGVFKNPYKGTTENVRRRGDKFVYNEKGI